MLACRKNGNHTCRAVKDRRLLVLQERVMLATDTAEPEQSPGSCWECGKHLTTDSGFLGLLVYLQMQTVLWK